MKETTAHGSSMQTQVDCILTMRTDCKERKPIPMQGRTVYTQQR